MLSLLSLLPIAGTILATVHAAPTCTTELPCDGQFVPTDGPFPLSKREEWRPVESGCWSDYVDQMRALEHFVGRFDDLTPSKCQSICSSMGFSLAGVEDGRECFCGNTIIGNNRPTPNCDTPCTGDPNQKCGGGYKINIFVKDNYPYSLGPAALLGGYNGYENTQCWRDDVNNRVFTGRPIPEIPGDRMTVQQCVDGCAAAGYPAAGLESDRECYCGNAGSSMPQVVDLRECNMPCLGNASQYCGGSNRILVYRKSPPSAPPSSPPSNPNPPANPPAPNLTTTTTTRTTSTPAIIPTQPILITYRGVIVVRNRANNQVLGYLSKNAVNNRAQYGYEPMLRDAMVVTFQAPAGATSVTRASLSGTNGNTGFPLVGLVQGRDNTNSNLAAGSFHYVYFAGANPSAPGASPQSGTNSYTAATGRARTYESAVWNINLGTGAATVQWINPGGSSPTMNLFTQSMALYAGGDAAAFFARYPAPVINISLTFVGI